MFVVLIIAFALLSVPEVRVVFADKNFTETGHDNSTRREHFGENYNLEDGCGRQIVRCEDAGTTAWCNPLSRIVGGRTTYRGEFPWMVMLYLRDNRNQFCAGTLLDNLHVLTANHCVFDFNNMAISRLRVVLGDYNIRSFFDGRHEERRVTELFKHPLWNRETNENDIAILKLHRPVQYSPYIQNICLPSLSLDHLVQLYEDEHDIFGTIVGWGRTATSHSLKSPIPLAAHVPLKDHYTCQKLYRPYKVSKNMFCAGGRGKDACIGDSGGPLLLKNRISGRWEQLGIISWGNNCHTLPGIYTKLENYLEWVRSIVKERHAR